MNFKRNLLVIVSVGLVVIGPLATTSSTILASTTSHRRAVLHTRKPITKVATSVSYYNQIMNDQSNNLFDGYLTDAATANFLIGSNGNYRYPVSYRGIGIALQDVSAYMASYDNTIYSDGGRDIKKRELLIDLANRSVNIYTYFTQLNNGLVSHVKSNQLQHLVSLRNAVNTTKYTITPFNYESCKLLWDLEKTFYRELGLAIQKIR